MAKYTLVLRDSGTAFSGMSPSEMQAIIARYTNWAQPLRDSGKIVASQKLRDGSGRVLRRSSNGVLVSDGPHAEAKEVIGGVFVLDAGSYDEAVQIAKGCPHLDFGTVEVREVEILR